MENQLIIDYCFKSILIELYVLSDFSSVILALNKHISEKNTFEPKMFQLLKIKNITKRY